MRCSQNLIGPTPSLFLHGTAHYLESDVNEAIAKVIVDDNGTYFQRGARKMSEDLAKATETINEAQKMMTAAVTSLRGTETNLADGAKRASQNVRKSASDLHEGLQRIEKLANFDRLERVVSTLERAAAALTVLAELETGGKLERIASAMKA